MSYRRLISTSIFQTLNVLTVLGPVQDVGCADLSIDRAERGNRRQICEELQNISQLLEEKESHKNMTFVLESMR